MTTADSECYDNDDSYDNKITQMWGRSSQLKSIGKFKFFKIFKLNRTKRETKIKIKVYMFSSGRQIGRY